MPGWASIWEPPSWVMIFHPQILRWHSVHSGRRHTPVPCLAAPVGFLTGMLGGVHTAPSVERKTHGVYWLSRLDHLSELQESLPLLRGALMTLETCYRPGIHPGFGSLWSLPHYQQCELLPFLGAQHTHRLQRGL